MREVVKVNKTTRTVEAEYRSAAVAARAAGMRADRMSDICRNETLPPGASYYRYRDSFDPCESFAGKRNCPVVLIDTETGACRRYGDMVECSRRAGWTVDYLVRCAKAGSLVGSRYLLRYDPEAHFPG